MIVTDKVLEELKQPIGYKWRTQSQNEQGCSCVAYIDSRDVQDLLDKVVGAGNWQTSFEVINNNLFGCLGIRVTHDDGITEWIWKKDVGTESAVEVEKGNASDSLKRAAVQFGIGRFLYALDIQRLNVKKHNNGKLYPCTKTGEILWSGDQLTDYINSRNNNNTHQDIPTTTVAGTPVVATPPAKKPEYSDDVINQVKALERDGKKGKACLKHYIPEFNKANRTSYVEVSEFDTDTRLLSLIKFIKEELPPTGI